MGVSGGTPRIPPQGFNERTYGRLLRSTWRLERRTSAGSWMSVGTFGDERAVSHALDEAVGEGRGTPADYRITRAARPGVWLAVAIGAILALAFVAFILIASG
jgi:hypothetical protein